MPHAENTVTINRPPADVFSFLADGETATQWRTGVVAINKVSGEGVGAIYKQTIRGPGGRSLAADYRVTQFEPDRALAFEAIAGSVRPHGRYDLTESGGSTVVSFTLDAELGGLKNLLMRRMVEKIMQSEVDALAQLKAVMGK